MFVGECERWKSERVVRTNEEVVYGMKQEQNVTVRTMEKKRKGKQEERKIESKREADGDEGLGRVAKPLRRKR